jgi:ribosomal 50S subunit-recycling heat shock protein
LRLDSYLFFNRLVKSRTLALGLIEAGHVRIDG